MKILPIKAKCLRPIKSTTEFFSVESVLYLDAINFFDAPGTIMFNGKHYLKICLSGRPENLILNSPQVRDTEYGKMLFGFDPKDLPECIEQGKIFDFSQYYRNPRYSIKGKSGYEYNYEIEDEFFLEKYILPYV